MNQQELEALLAQIAPNNDPRRLVFNEASETVEIEVPSPYGASVPGEKKKVPVRVLQWTDPGTGMVLKVQADPAGGTYTKTFQGIDPKSQGAPATTPAQQAQEELGTEISSRQVTDANGKTVKITTYRRSDGSTYDREDSVQAAPPKPEVVAGTLNTTSPNVGTVVNGVLTWTPNPNYKKAKPEPLTTPSTQKYIMFQNENGTVTSEPNPNYKPPSQLIRNPTTGRMQQVTEDEQGKPVIRDVTEETTVRPSDLPVLQAKYGEIGQGLGTLAADLNRRYSAGEITAEERNRAFEAAHAQATTQVTEINTILDNSRAIWSGELQQRGQTLGETQSRRSYASSMLTNATGVGSAIAQSAGPGHGQAIAQGVQSLLNIGQNYAQGMGGFRESPEIQLPKALQQARETGLPGMAAPSGMPGSPAGLPAQSAGAGPSPTPVGPSPTPDASLTPSPAAGFEAGSGISDTTDRGGVPREYTPASASTPAPADASLAQPASLTPQAGINPLVAQLAQRLLGGMGYGGSPVAAGGGGVFDPMEEAARMTQGSDDPDWTAAVMRAARGNPDQQQPGYQRFFD